MQPLVPAVAVGGDYRAVHVAVARVSVDDGLKAVGLGGAAQKLEQLGDARGRYDEVFLRVALVDGGYRFGHVLARLPDAFLRAARVGDVDFVRPVLLRELSYLLVLAFDYVAVVVLELDDERRARVARGDLRVEVARDDLQRLLVDELDRGGDEAALFYYLRHEVYRRLRVGEGREQVDGVARHRHELEHGLRDDGERALRAAEQVDEVEARHVLAPLAAEPCDGAVGEDAFEREHLRARRAVFDDLVAARVLRDVAADERRVAAARVAGVEQPARGRGAAYLGGHDAGLRRHGEVRLVDFEDSVHLFEAHDYSAVYGKRAARQPRARAARRDGDALARGDLHNFGDVRRALGKDEQRGAVFALVCVRGHFVVRVAFELLGLRADVVRADFAFCLGDYLGSDFIVGKDAAHLCTSCVQTHAIIT